MLHCDFFRARFQTSSNLTLSTSQTTSYPSCTAVLSYSSSPETPSAPSRYSMKRRSPYAGPGASTTGASPRQPKVRIEDTPPMQEVYGMLWWNGINM